MFKPMLAKFYLKRKQTVKFPVFIQPKLDGVRLCWDGETLASRYGKEIALCFKDMRQALSLFAEGIPLDGELFSKDVPFDEISGHARRKSGFVDEERIIFWIFDSPGPEGIEQRFARIQEVFKRRFITQDTPLGARLAHTLKVVPSEKATSFQDIEEHLMIATKAGYEGVIIRDMKAGYQEKRTDALLKYKRWKTGRFLVVGQIAGKGRHLGRMGALIIRLETGKTCKVGTGFSDPIRDLFRTDPPARIPVMYQEKTKKALRFPVFLENRWFEEAGG